MSTYVQLPTIPATVNFVDGFTIETKQKWANFGTYYARIFDTSPGNAGAGNIGISHQQTTNNLDIFLGNDSDTSGNDRHTVTNYFELNTVQTTKVVLKKNSSTSYTLTTYKNGTLVDTYNYNHCPVSNSAKTHTYIGRSSWYGSVDGDGTFPGTIYYVKLTLADGTKVVDVDFNKA